MGILILLDKFIGQFGSFTTMMLSIAIHIMGVYYLYVLHPKAFIQKPTKIKSFLFALMGIGFGQAYNRQIKKAIAFLSMYPLILLIAGLFIWTKKEITDEIGDFAAIAILILIIVSAIDAVISARKASKIVINELRTKEVNKKRDYLFTYIEKGYSFALDTNILIHEPDLIVSLLNNKNGTINLSKIVFQELDGLKKNSDPVTRKRAQLSFDIIEEYQRQGALKLIEGAKSDEIRQFGLGSTPDERIIGTYIKAQNQGQKLLFISNDKGARIIARNIGLPVAEIS